MRLIFLVFALFNIFCATSQNNESHGRIPVDTSYTIMYNTLKELYLKKKNSPSQIQAMKLQKQFWDRSNLYKNTTFDQRKYINNADDLLSWIKGNIEKTDFITFEAALEEDRKIKEAVKYAMEENSELYEYLKQVAKIHGSEMYGKIILEVEMNK